MVCGNSKLIDPELGYRLRERRESLNLTIAEVSEQCGVAPSTITRYERRQRYPNGAMFPKLAAVLQVPVEWFFDPTVNPDSYSSRLTRKVPYVDMVCLGGANPLDAILQKPEVLNVPTHWIDENHQGFVVRVGISPDKKLIPDNSDLIVQIYAEGETPPPGKLILITAGKTPCVARTTFSVEGVSLKLFEEEIALNSVTVLGEIVMVAQAA